MSNHLRLLERIKFEDLLARSSLGTPEARQLIDESRNLFTAKLTGMPEEQADWEADQDGDL